MLSLIILCMIIYILAYVCLKKSGESMEVTPIQSFEDYFIGIYRKE
ncbi:hypothetical protein AB1L07_13650 [Niallia alba]|uniref:Uncharacterized protein n=1 Tax=Niallia circulans TaxID=1397 RepID=A0A941GQJ9_NIACI|nr:MULTISPECIES: hypothetical protein [Niallia]MCB5238369.1 hypothetical protein [Niallia circulans]MDU1845070.1 hypothetical protein [Niallia nealsonii]MED3793870.1 hypothetical protein [Niallia alba]